MSRGPGKVGGFVPDDTARRMSELRPMAATIRLLSALLVVLVIVSSGVAVQRWLYVPMLLFCAWTVFNLWREATGRGDASHPSRYVVLVLVLVVVVRGTEHGVLLLPVALQPLVMLSLLHGLRMGLLTSGIGASALVLQWSPPGIDAAMLLPALGLLLAPPVAVFVARPWAALRHRVVLAAELEQTLDLRRGLPTVGLAIADRLRDSVAAQRVVICHLDAEQPTVLVSDRDDGAYVASAMLAGPLLQGLAELPTSPLAFDSREASPLNADPGVDRSAILPQLRLLSQLLQAERLQLVPDAPGSPRSGWMLVAYGAADKHPPRRGAAALWQRASAEPWPLPALAAFAVEMRRLLQPASNLDSLQAEIAAHERARIGRDLHDSAVQPYLGLKFAIDVLAQRCEPGNPLHAQVRDLRAFCEAELAELRDTVAVLRSGELRGDNALIPSLRRQAKRFGTLFGIHTTLEVPDELVTSRALAGALLHMVNEALNNVRRHTRAQNVWVRLESRPDGLHLRVRDDAGRHGGGGPRPFEPRSLSERVRELGGSLAVHQPDGLGTEIHITVPA